MAFSPHKCPPQLIDFLNLFSKDCPSTVTSSSFTNLSSEAEPEFIELSLGVKAPVTTSSIIDHSRLLKRKRLSQHQELVNATSSVKGSNLSSSSSQENERRVDEEKKALGPLLDEAKEEFGPISSWDFKEVQEAFGPISVGTREGFGPISSLDLEKVEEAFGPISNDTKEAFGSISSSMLHEAKEALGPISPATLEEAKEAFTEKAQE
nr:hypothetical protein [Tanacetum cinerariifolium]